MELRVSKSKKFRLLARDREIVRMVARGLTAKEISEEGGLMVRTVEKILYDLRSHYKCKNSAHLVATFFHKKLID